MRPRLLTIAIVSLGFSVATFAASEASADTSSSSSSATTSPQPSVRTEYIIQPGDTLHVIVFQEDELTRDVKVSAETTITLPMIGLVELKGLTPRDAQEVIRKRYDADYIVNPQINVTVIDYSRRSVNVIGSVNTPGAVLFPQEEGMTLLDAITRAGGFSRLADKKHVKLSRTNASGKIDTIIINADDIISGSATEQWSLLKDDVIYVPERVI